MHDTGDRIADILLEVEATLRRNDLWDARRPAVSAMNSTVPFCLDTLRFDELVSIQSGVAHNGSGRVQA